MNEMCFLFLFRGLLYYKDKKFINLKGDGCLIVLILNLVMSEVFEVKLNKMKIF